MGIARDVRFASASGNEGILSHTPLRREAEVKLSEDVPEKFRKKFSLLLDEDEIFQSAKLNDIGYE